MSKRKKTVEIGQERKKRKWTTRLAIWSIGGCGLLFACTLIGQATGIFPTAEELDATRTADAAVAVATDDAIAGLTAVAQANIDATLTAMPTPTPTITPSATPTTTPTLTSTTGPSPTPTLTPTVTPSATITPTPTPRPTDTPIPTLSPDEQLAAILADEVGGIRESRFYAATGDIYTEINLMMGFSAPAIDATEQLVIRILCAVQEPYPGRAVTIEIIGQFVDEFGSEFEARAMQMVVPAENIARINCDNQFSVNLRAISESWYEHPALRQ